MPNLGVYSDEEIQQYQNAQTSPISPTGLQQTGAAAEGVATKDPAYANSKQGESALRYGLAGTARNWYTGANNADVENGWDTTFIQDWMEQDEAATAAGTSDAFFDAPDATGVVLYDGETAGGKKLTFGQIYDGGEVVGKIYDQFDRDTANLMLADLLFDGPEKAHLFADSDPVADNTDKVKLPSLNDAVKEARDSNTENMKAAREQGVFNMSVEEREEALREGHGAAQTIVAATAASAGLGAGGGAVLGGPVGAVAGAVGLGTAGGVGAALNIDSLLEQRARVEEITSLSMEQHGRLAGLATGVSQYAGFGAKMIAPMSNLTQGIYDAAAGDVGDGTSEFYNVDEEGKTTAPAWVKVADVAASFADAGIQFMSPVGVGMYSAQMSGVILGEVGELALTQSSFDYRTGQFDNVFTDEEGNFDFSSAAAGIGKVGIDVVQLGFARSLVGKARGEQLSYGATAETAPYRLTMIPGVERVTGALPKWLGGQSDKVAARAAMEGGGKRMREGAFEYTLDASGKAVSRRATLSLLAPSEQLGALGVGAMARRASVREKPGSIAADDFYRQATRMAHGDDRLKNILVNGFGEGYEEGLQEIFETYSHQHDLDWRAVGNAAMYGFAMGAGMTAAAGARGASADKKMFFMAKAGREHMSFGKETITEAEWAAMSVEEKRTATAFDSLSKELFKSSARKIAYDQAAGRAGGTAAVHKLSDAAQAVWVSENAKANPRLSGAFVITQSDDVGTRNAEGNLAPGSIPTDGVGASAMQTDANLRNHWEGLQVHLTALEDQMRSFDQRIDEALEPEEINAQRAALQARIDETQLVIDWAGKIGPELEEMMKDMYLDSTGLADLEADVEQINMFLRLAFNREINKWHGEAMSDADKMALARAVSFVFVRDPQDQSGSFQVLVPQVSSRLTWANSNEVLEISHAILPAIRGDYDGDKMRLLANLVMDETQYVNARSGQHFIGAGASVNIPAPKYENYIVGFMGEALQGRGVRASLATQAMTAIGSAIKFRYRGVVDNAVMDTILGEFYDAIRAGSKNARAILLDGLAGTEAGGVINEFARDHLSNEWFWIDQLVKSHMNQFQMAWAEDQKYTEDPNTEVVPTVDTESEVHVRRTREAAVPGMTMSHMLVGGTMFRMFQKLHYTLFKSSELVVDKNHILTGPATRREFSEFYAAVGSGVGRSELDSMRAKDDVTARALWWLNQLADDLVNQKSIEGTPITKQQSIAIVANMAVLDFDVNSKGEVVFSTNSSGEGKRITAAQFFLKQSMAVERQQLDAIWDVSPELQAKHARLRAMVQPESRKKREGRGAHVNAERAFVEVFGSQQLYTILGEEAAVFGPHLTLEQYVRMYVAMHEEDRTQTDWNLKHQPEYLGRKSSKNIPYELNEVNAAHISAFRSVTDSILAVGHNRITIDKDGYNHGEYEDQSRRTSEDLQVIIEQIQKALRTYLGKSQDDDLTYDMVARVLDGNSDFAKKYLNLIPNATAAAVLEERKDGVFVSNWVYELLTMSNPTEAEMHYWRNLLLAEINALGAKQLMNSDRPRDDEFEVSYSKLPRRMHRIIVDLGRLKDGGIRLRQFVDKMENADDLREFIKWVNTTPGIRGNQPPLTAWTDDVSMYDADKADGGWTKKLDGAELREAIRTLREASVKLARDAIDEVGLLAKDQIILDTMASVTQEEMPGDNEVARGEAESLRIKMQGIIDLAAQMRTGLGSAQMIMQGIGAIRGFYPQAHTKGKNPDYVEVQGMFDAQVDALGFLTNYDRMMAYLTTHSLDQVAGSLHELAKDDVRTMDDNGQTVEWAKPTVDSMINLLRNPETRALARSILFPQVMERTPDGQITTQMLQGKSLADLLDGSAMRELFPKDGQFTVDRAFGYGSAVEAISRDFGGHAEFQRAVNDLVQARTSGASRKLEDSDLRAMWAEATHHVAMVLQYFAALDASVADPVQNDLLKPIIDNMRAAQVAGRAAAGLDIEVKFLDETLDFHIAKLEEEALRDTTEVQQTISGRKSTTAEKRRVGREVLKIQANLEIALEKIEAFRGNNGFQQVVQMFTIDPDASEVENAPKKNLLIDFVNSHMHMFELANESTALVEIDKLSAYMMDPKNVKIPGNVNWDVLGRAAIGMYADEVLSEYPSGVEAPMYPDAEHEEDRRYFDPSYVYLLEKLADRNGPLLQGAKKLQGIAGRFGADPTDVDAYDLITRTVLDNDKLGPWTTEIYRASAEANARLDSASAAAALSQNGDAPKNQDAFNRAMERRYIIPGTEALSQTELTYEDLFTDNPFEHLVEYTWPTGSTTKRKFQMAVLNNRFASEVFLIYTDPETGEEVPVNLLQADKTLGRIFDINQDAIDSGYKEINIARIQSSVDSYIDVNPALAIDPAKIRVVVNYFHPDTQPSEINPATGGDKWTNNLFYEGTNFGLDADTFKSLNAGLWFAPGGISPEGQAKALDASKLGVPAMQPIDLPTAAERKAFEELWKTDFAGMLRKKTLMLIQKDLGFGALDQYYFNAVHKNMKMRHYVVGKDEAGDEVMWSAEQVIQSQLTGVPPMLTEARLWVPSETVLRSMLGEQGTKGVARLDPNQLKVDTTLIPIYTGVKQEWLEDYAGIRNPEALPIEKTDLAARAKANQYVSRPYQDDHQVARYTKRFEYLTELESEIHTARSNARQGDADATDSKFSPTRNLRRALKATGNMLDAANLAFGWRSVAPWIGPRHPQDYEADKVVFREYEKLMEETGDRSGFVFLEGGKSNPPKGILSQQTIGGKMEKKHSVAPGDLVVILLDGFTGEHEAAKKLAKQRIDYFIGRGATIALGNYDGLGDMPNELSEYLRSKDYEYIPGSKFGFKPMEQESRYQTPQARLSTLTETRGISPAGMAAFFHVVDKPVEENAAWKIDDDEYKPGIVRSRWRVDGNKRLAAAKVVLNLVPSDAYGGVNVPVSPEQIKLVREHLRNMNNEVALNVLREQSNKWQKDPKKREELDIKFDEAWQRLMNTFNDNPEAVLPGPNQDFGTADFIPLVDMTGRIVLYRHGMKAPHADQLENMWNQKIPGRDGAQNVAVYSSEANPAATVHTGKVIEFRPRSGFGLSVEMKIDLQQFGDKKQLEWNGMKYVLAPKPNWLKLPDHGFFANGWAIDVIGSMHDTMSKENYEGMVNNHRNAFAYFGVDFLDDITKFFYPAEGATDNTRSLTRKILRDLTLHPDRLPLTAAHELLSGGEVAAAFRELLPELSNAELKKDWMVGLGGNSFESKVATAAIIYLMTPGAKVEHILKSGGFNDSGNKDLEGQSRYMPRLFTQFFDRQQFGSVVRKEMFLRFNQQLHNPNTDGTGYVLRENWRFETRMADPKQNMSGWLQFAEVHSSGDNPITNGMAFDENGREGVSKHSAALAYGALGVQTTAQRQEGRALLTRQGKNLVRFKAPKMTDEGTYDEADAVDGGAWEMLTRSARTMQGQGSQWRIQSPGEVIRRDYARELVRQFRKTLDFTQPSWTDNKEYTFAKYDQLRIDIMKVMKLDSKQKDLVDFWVRQHLGQPEGKDKQGNPVGNVTAKAAIEAAHDILNNVTEGFLPTLGAEVPALHVHDLQTIFRAQKGRRDQWRPKTSMRRGSDKRVEMNWDNWVSLSLGSIITSDNLFDPMFLLAVDGMMHSYQAATQELIDLPVSVDALTTSMALDPSVNQAIMELKLVDEKGKFRTSVDPNAQILATDSIILDTERATIEDIIGGKRIGGKYRGEYPPASEVAKRRDARRKWRKANGVPMPVDQSLRDLVNNGERFKHEAQNTNSFTRMLINLRVGTATLNPALWVSMGPEMWVRGMLDRSANILTGQSSVGATGALHSKVTEKITQNRYAIKGDTGKQIIDPETGMPKESFGYRVQEAFGLGNMFTPLQRGKLKNLYEDLGQRKDFRAMIYRDLVYLRPGEPGVNRLERILEGYAKFGTKMQDPTYGMKADNLARRYMEAVIQHIERMPTANVLTIDQLIAVMSTNPEWLKDNLPEAHAAGSAAIAQIRSLKQTVMGSIIKGIYEPMSNSPKLGVNLFGNLFLKVPMLFSTYAFNVATTITGMQGLDQMVAMFADGRRRPHTALWRATQAMAGKEFTAEDDIKFNSESILEGIDLSRAFIRGGLTHTGLFLMGMAAGGLGLSGEDDETKKRRRLHEQQGTAFFYDPRALENDFRNEDAIYAGWLPLIGSDSDMVHLNWTMKQFISPIIGIERFFETGNFAHVTWGFQDAISSFPIINSMGWDDAVATAHEIANQAAIEQGRPGGDAAAVGLLAGAVGTYERMLFENAFVNQLYVSLDRWDRDPYSLPLRDSDGVMQKDIENLPRENDLAMVPYRDPETGEVKMGYEARDTTSAMIHALTENRATMAFLGFLGSVATGQGPDYLRYNMPVKKREIEVATLGDTEAETLIIQDVINQWSQEQNFMPGLTPEEVENQVREDLYKRDGIYYPDSVVMPIARSISKNSQPPALTVIDDYGKENLTTEGAMYAYRTMLKDPTLRLNAEAFKGLHVTWEQRAEIQEKWMDALIQEGVDLGLDPSKAKDRMERLWNGPFEDPRIPGIGDILWAKPENGGLSYGDTIIYQQMNTTYITGPDGLPWATGRSRKSLTGILAAFGVSPVVTPLGAGDDSMGLDERMNSTNLIEGANTGLRGLVRTDESRNVPTDKEIADMIAESIEKAKEKDYKPLKHFDSGSKGGGYGYGGHGYYGGYGGYGGGGGGYYSGPRIYYQEFDRFTDVRDPYGSNIPFINTSNPTIRRGSVRRERVWSERGRLKQWQ